MGLQFGSEKCEKLHIGKKHVNQDICPDLEVDVLKDYIVQTQDGNTVLDDKHIGKEKMITVYSKKYLGQIIQSDGRNE